MYDFGEDERQVEINIYGAHSTLTGRYPLSIVKDITSYPVEGAEFSKAYRSGRWDGRTHLFKTRGSSFPTGLVKIVKETLEDLQYTVLVHDHRIPPKIVGPKSFELEGVKFEYPYDYQLDICKQMVKAKQGIIKASTNSGKTEIACAVTRYLGLRTLFIVSTVELMYQGQKRFMKRLGLTEKEVGIVGDGNWSPGSLVTIAMLHTLESRLDTDECLTLLNDAEVLFVDECHHVGSKTWYVVLTLCPAFYRFALSGTPLDRGDGANLRLIAATGEVIVNIENKFLVDRGVSARANIIFDKITAPVLQKKIKYPTAYKQGVVENEELMNRVLEWVRIFNDKKLNILILCEEIAHGELLSESLWTKMSPFVPNQFIHGSEDTETRAKALESFGERKLPVLVASTILDEGVDVSTIDVLILTGSKESTIRTKQRLGRGLRGDKLIVVEFANFCHKYLLKHSLTRLQDYKKEECFPIHFSGPDKELVDKIWEEPDVRKW